MCYARGEGIRGEMPCHRTNSKNLSIRADRSSFMTTKEFAKILQDKLTSEYGVDLSVASHQQIYRALALICRQMMSENHKKFQIGRAHV